MGDLKPIGSEKLQGMEKINRMIEIARYKEYVPKSINENSSTEYNKVLSDGMNYQIIKEKSGYVLKRGLNESESDYIEPMKHRRYFNSYSQALKRLNLIAKEVNVNEGYDKNLSLFTESEDDSERFYLKSETNEQAPAPAPAPAPVPAPAPSPEMSVSPEPAPETTDVPPVDDMGMEDMTDTEGEEQPEEEVTYKTIQKLTGKLGQKIRTFLSNEENQMSSKDIKYVINSVLSALDLNSLEDEDKEEIMGKFEGVEYGDEESPEMPQEEPEMTPETPEVPQPEGEMGEEFDFSDDEMSDREQRDLMKSIFGDKGEMEEEYPRHKKHGSRTVSKLKHRGLKDEEATKVEEMIEGIFGESKVENVLKKYFKIDEKERLMTEQRKRDNMSQTTQTEKTRQRIKNLSENVAQEVASAKLIKKYPNAKLMGKNKNNKSLVFEIQNKTLRVTPKGSIL